MKLAIPQHKRYGRWLKPAILCNIDCSFATVRYDIYCTVCVQCTVYIYKHFVKICFRKKAPKPVCDGFILFKKLRKKINIKIKYKKWLILYTYYFT